MKWSAFTPVVSVYDDGTIDCEWFDCMISSFAEPGSVELQDLIEEHSEVLDERLALIRDFLDKGIIERRETDKPTVTLAELVRPFFEKPHG